MDALGRYAHVRALRALLADPESKLSIRALAGAAGISPSAAKASLDFVHSLGIAKFEAVGRSHLYRPDLESPLARQWKVLFSLEELEGSGLVGRLRMELNPISITLYGSLATGTGDSKSDIDLLVITNSKAKMQLAASEAKLGREINMLVLTPSEWVKKAKGDKVFHERVVLDSVQLYGKKPVVL